MHRFNSRPGWFATIVSLSIAARAVHAQQVTALTPSWQEAIAARDVEMYLRVAQLAGQAPMTPWSIRGLSPETLDRIAPRDSAHPWAARFRRDTATGALRVHLFSPELDVMETTGYPVLGLVDGPVWSGRGLTTVLTAGVQLRTRHVSLTIRPTAFRAENVRWSEAPAAAGSSSPDADPLWACCIDLPQRIARGAYARLDPGESTLRVSGGPLAVGVSSATQVWGPSDENPLILGAGAAGIPHVFIETARPLPVGIGRVQMRLVVGRPGQSSIAPDSGRARKIAGGVMTFTPRGAPGLELGLIRFFHAWSAPEGPGLRDFLLPFSGLFESTLAPGRFDDPNKPDYRPKNEIASAFARWATATGRAELWMEYAKNDHPLNHRDLVVEPDHDAAWTLGARHVLASTASRTVALRLEYVSAGVSHLQRVRTQVPMYIHTPITQGHTQIGQLLASTAAYGGGGLFARLDAYTRGGTTTLGIERFVRKTPPTAEGPSPSDYDVIYRARADRTMFRRAGDVMVGLLGEYELNRDFRRDVPNFQVRLGFRPRRASAR